MNRVEQVLKEQGRSKTWLASRLNVSRQLLDYKIEHDTFTGEQQALTVHWLATPFAELFPEPDPSPEAV